MIYILSKLTRKTNKLEDIELKVQSFLQLSKARQALRREFKQAVKENTNDDSELTSQILADNLSASIQVDYRDSKIVIAFKIDSVSDPLDSMNR